MDRRLKLAGLLGFLCVAVSAAGQLLQADQPVPQHEPASNVDFFPLGVPCHVRFIVAGEQKTQFGKILKVAPEALVLEPHHERPPMWTRLPYIERKYKNTGETVPTGEKEVRIPRSSIRAVIVHRQPEISISQSSGLDDSEKVRAARTGWDAAVENSQPQAPAIRSAARRDDHDEFKTLEAEGWTIIRSPEPQEPREGLAKPSVSTNRAAPGGYDESKALQDAGWTIVSHPETAQHQPSSGGPQSSKNRGVKEPHEVPPAGADSRRTASKPAKPAMESQYYLRDDVKYFPDGPEFKLSRQAEAIEEYNRRQKLFQKELVGSAAKFVEANRDPKTAPSTKASSRDSGSSTGRTSVIQQVQHEVPRAAVNSSDIEQAINNSPIVFVQNPGADAKKFPNGQPDANQLLRVSLRPNIEEHLFSQSRRQTVYVGRIAKVKDGRYLLKAIRYEQRNSSRSRLFFGTNSGVGQEDLDNKEVWIDRNEIESIEIAN